jgi:hypothetical protein
MVAQRERTLARKRERRDSAASQAWREAHSSAYGGDDAMESRGEFDGGGG